MSSPIKNASVSLRNRITAGWYALGSEVDIVAAGNSLSIQGNALQQLYSDARKNGQRPYIVSMAVTQRWTYNCGDATATLDAFTAQVQRGCCTTLQISQPNFKSRMAKTAQSLSQWDMFGRVVNPMASALRLCHPIADTDFPSSQLRQGNYGTPAEVQYANGDDIEGWRDDANFAQVDANGAAVAVSTSDIYMIPLCMFSGTNGYGGLFKKDRIPLAVIADNNTPWVFNMNVSSTTTPDSLIFVTGVTVRSLKIYTQVWAFVVFEPDSSDYCFGVPWESENMPLAGGGSFNIQPHYYRGLFVAPLFNSAQTDNGVEPVVCPYQPDNFMTEARTGIIRWNANGEQQFPLDNFSDWRYLFDLVNLGYAVRSNPRIGASFAPDYAIKGTSTVLISSGSGLSGFIDPRQDPQYMGQWSSMPLFFLLMNLFAAEGFPPCFMGVPRSNETQLQINLGQTSLSTAQLNRVYGIWCGEYSDSDSRAMASADRYGVCNCGTKDLPTFVPAVDNSESPRVQLAAPFLPKFAKNG